MDDLKVDIRLDGIEINGRLYTYPILLTDLDALFDEEPEIDEKSGSDAGMWWWFDAKVRATHKDGVHMLGLQMHVDVPGREILIEGRPFGEQFGPYGPTYPNHDFGNGYIMARRSDPGPDQKVIDIRVEQKMPRKSTKKPAAAKATAVKKTAPAIDAAEFTDLNFKLLVVQELMYSEQLLTPAFDVHEFIEGYSERAIDIDDEGYDPIPEVLQYFADLPVPKSLLSEVTSIYQDGGNDIYLQIAPLWSGEDEAFDVTNFADVDLLPNLTSITLIGEDDELLEPLRAKGIEADLL